MKDNPSFEEEIVLTEEQDGGVEEIASLCTNVAWV